MPATDFTKTLLVSSPDPELSQSVARLRPDLRLLPIEPGPGRVLDGEEAPWCFVEWLARETSGLEIVRRLREDEATRRSHITMVLDIGDSEERRRALKAGADDYMHGPLDAVALIERIALYERAGREAPLAASKLSNGELTIDLAAHQLRWRGAPVALRPNEFRLLVHFIENRDQVFSRTALIARLGKQDETIDERTVDVWVGRLRRALVAAGAPDPLRTVRSLGYVMDSVES